ncbi:MAG: hypothetical protein WCP39_07590, partial [Chlamydiota bacterium]
MSSSTTTASSSRPSSPAFRLETSSLEDAIGSQTASFQCVKNILDEVNHQLETPNSSILKELGLTDGIGFQAQFNTNPEYSNPPLFELNIFSTLTGQQFSINSQSIQTTPRPYPNTSQ